MGKPITSTAQLRDGYGSGHDHSTHTPTIFTPVTPKMPSKKVKKLKDLEPIPLEPVSKFVGRRRKESIAYSVISAVSLIYEDLAKGAKLTE